ncbi:MAG: hypothetical protein ACRYGK_16425 [Janthinobacterium lividum]
MPVDAPTASREMLASGSAGLAAADLPLSLISPAFFPQLPAECWSAIAQQMVSAPLPLPRMPRLTNWPACQPTATQTALRSLVSLGRVNRCLHEVSETALLQSIHGGERVEQRFRHWLNEYIQGQLPPTILRERLVALCSRHEHLSLTFSNIVEGKAFDAAMQMLDVLPGIFSCPQWRSLTLVIDFQLAVHHDIRKRLPALLSNLIGERTTPSAINLTLRREFASDLEGLDLYAGMTATSPARFSALDFTLASDGHTHYGRGFESLVNTLREDYPGRQCLRSLQLSYVPPIGKNISPLFVALRKNRSLLALHLKSRMLDEGSVPALTSMLQENQALTSLGLIAFHSHASACLAGLVHNTRIDTLNVRFVEKNNRDNSLGRELDCIAASRSITHLTLRIDWLDLKNGQCVAEFIGRNSMVRELVLEADSGLLKGLYPVLRALGRNQQLERFTVTGMALNATGAQHLSVALKRRQTGLHVYLDSDSRNTNQEAEVVWVRLRRLLSLNPRIRCTAKNIELAPA